MAAGAVSLRKSHDIVILSFCNIVKGQANCLVGLIVLVWNMNLQKYDIDNQALALLKIIPALGSHFAAFWPFGLQIVTVA